MNDLEIVVLAAGKSTRSYPLSKGIAHKSLLPLGSKKIIDYVIDYIIDAKMKHITFVVADSCAERAFKDCIDYTQDNMEIKFVYQSVPKGLSHAIGLASVVSRNRDLLVILPDDVFFNQNEFNPLKLLIDRYTSSEFCRNVFLSRKVRDYTRWGIIENGFLREKPKEAASFSASVMCFTIDKIVVESIFLDMEKILIAGEEVHYSYYLNRAIEEKKTPAIQTIDVDKYNAKYLDCGTIKGYEEALIYFLLTHSENKEANKLIAKKQLSQLC
jgi:dTDP-glucose pyrophosphorylase